jgi:TetR/AcrR family transcriptional regulator, transcriptional repressor for nem operon
MRYSKEHKDETHQRIVKTAGARFRAEGVDGVGVASVMQSVGLTVGGFYAHFGSKEDLVAEACSDAFATTTAGFRAFIESKPAGRRFRALVDAYLSPRHRDDPGNGCTVAANGAELARHPTGTRAVFSEQINAWVKLITEAMHADGLQGDARGVAGTLVGTMILARAIADPALSETYLQSGRNAVMASVQRQAV